MCVSVFILNVSNRVAVATVNGKGLFFDEREEARRVGRAAVR